MMESTNKLQKRLDLEADNGFIRLTPAVVRACGGKADDAALLIRLLHWTRVYEDDPKRDGWFWFSYTDAEEQIGMTKNKYYGSVKRLTKLEFVEVNKAVASGHETNWVRVNPVAVLSALNSADSKDIAGIDVTKEFKKAQKTKKEKPVDYSKYNEYAYPELFRELRQIYVEDLVKNSKGMFDYSQAWNQAYDKKDIKDFEKYLDKIDLNRYEV